MKERKNMTMMGNQMRTNDGKNGDKGIHKQHECGHSIWLCNWKHWNDKHRMTNAMKKHRVGERVGERKESEKDYWISSWTIVKSNCEATVTNGMSNLTAHYIITKWVPWSSHENLITQYSNWHTTFFSHSLDPTQSSFVFWYLLSRSPITMPDFSSFSVFLRI